MKNLVYQIITPHLKLRMLDFTDASDLQKLMANNRENMLPWIPWAESEPETVLEKKEKIRSWKGEFYLDQKYTYGIFDQHDDMLCGLIFLFTRQGEGILEIGYMIDQNRSGKGFATEASYALAKLGFSHIGIDKIVIHCSPNNKPSVKIPEKLGFTHEGTHTLPERNVEGHRTKLMIWAMFNEQFKVDNMFEPVNFELEKGF